MSIKKLRNQLFAAIAMVLVASIALGSSTYAWFVSNNSVTATTTSIYAQSNSAYLLISNKANGSTTEAPGSLTATNADGSVALYPATWTNNAAVKVDDTTNTGASWLFATGYAKDANKPDINDDGLFAIKAADKTTGSPEAAVDSKYAYLNSFYVGTGNYDGTFTNLKVSNMKIAVTGANELTNALRVLVKCGNEWVVGKVAYTDANNQAFSIENGSHKTAEVADGIIRTAAFGKSATGEGSTAGDVQVDVYIYYEGADSRVFSDNLNAIKADGVKATVTFEATPTEFGA